ncbi:MurR/RpiR family transcriptional regulator [Frankia sp. Mgl5]|nr:MurR/RpiR family transcriptional regulator [Frankia sp. Mgl5]
MTSSTYNRRPDAGQPAAADNVADGGTITAQLRARMPTLTPSGQRIGQVVLAEPRDIIHMTVTDLAERTETSVATIVRFCQDISLKGFADLKIRLAAESIPAERGLHEDVAATDEPATVLDKILHSTAQAITEASGTVDHDSFAHAVLTLTRAERLLVVGVGTSSPLAQDAAYRFRTAGITAEAPLDPHVQHVTARLLHPGTACLAISHTGQTQETLASAAAAKQAGADTIALTSFYRSPLTKIVETCLVAGSRETNFRIEAMSSRIIHSTVLDALYVAVCLANPERAQTTQQLTAEVLAEHRI